MENLYVFADRCNVPALREALIGDYWGSNSVPSFSELIRALRNLSSTSPLYMLFFDLYMPTYDPTVDKSYSMELKMRQSYHMTLLLP